MEKTSLLEWSDGAFADGASPRGESGMPGLGEAPRAFRPARRPAPGEGEGGAGLRGRLAAPPGSGAASPGSGASAPARLAAYLRAIDL